MRRLFNAIIDRTRRGVFADWYIVAIAVSLPWSTSATAFLIVLWVIALLLSRDVASIQREVMTAAGGLPVLLWGLAAIGMLWADVGWNERIEGMRGFHKLLFIPLLLAQFRRSDRAKWAILGFFISAMALLIVSWVLTRAPGLWGREKADVGVPVKDYVAQSGIFAMCAFALLGQAVHWWRTHRRRLAQAAFVAAAAFFANIVYMATARTTLVVMAVLLLLFGFRQFRWKGMVVAGLLGGVLAGLSWASSPYLRGRVSHVVAELRDYGGGNGMTSVGLRFTFWKKSIELVAAAPLVGHGTGTIEALFRHDAAGTPAVATGNPHSQILAVAIQLGLVGTIVLVAMWIAHLGLFRDETLFAWFGLVIVVGNIVSSVFNSHLFDFTQGWLYVFGVGIVGGTILGRTQHEISGGQCNVTPNQLHHIAR
jgi:O-antigen ligase